jgi:hypothetical protein
MVFYPLMSKLSRQRGIQLGDIPPERHIPEITFGLSRRSSDLATVIEPAQDETWVLRMRSVQATVCGAPRKWALYTTINPGASLRISTASTCDIERSVEEDEARLRREVRMFDLQSRQAVGLAQRRLRNAGAPDVLSVVGDWSEDTVSVDGRSTATRSARVGDSGWIAWWSADGQIIEMQSNAVPPSQIPLVCTSIYP